MKINAVRVRDVGHFSAPTALEGLSGGLDVLAAGNEAGKSTLFKAIEVAFFEKHTGTGERIRGITPRSGGAPLIEVDFGVNGEIWRITKAFGRGKRAVLTQMGGAGRELRGAEAEDGLAQLVGMPAGRPGRLGFLWVGQGGALQPLPPDAKRGDAAALQQIVEREVSALTGGSLVRRLRSEVSASLGVFKTPKRMEPKTNGPWDVAVKRMEEIASGLELAKAARQEAVQRREALAALKARRMELTAPDRAGLAREAITTAIKARDEGVAARRLLRDVQVRVSGLEGALKDAQRAVADLQTLLDENESLDAGIRDGGERLAAAERALAERRAEVAGIEAKGDALRAEEGLALAAIQAAERATLAVQARVRLGALEQTLASAEALEADIAAGAEELAALAVDGALFERLVAADTALKRAGDALAAGAPLVTIAYEAGATERVRVEGQPVPEGVVASSAGPLRLEIPGIGVITIAAAATVERARHLKEHGEANAELERGLSALGVGDLEAAAARHRKAMAKQAALDALRARLSGLAPSGVPAIAREVAAAREALDATPLPDAHADRDGAQAILDQVRTSLGELRLAYRAKVGEIEPLVALVGRERDGLERARGRLDAIARDLPPVERRSEEIARLIGLAGAAGQAVNGALRELAAVRETAPDDARLAALELRVSGLQAEDSRIAAELQAIEVGSARLEGEEAKTDAQGLSARVPELEGELARARAEVSRYELEVAALTLLAETVDAAEAENLERYLTPVLRNLNPYLDMVFPGARLRLSGNFAVGGLERSGGFDDLDLLSGGTQEQLAVLVRLAFAGLAARAGHSAPLILDDALVYSDDERLKRIFDALAVGASMHQVIVLTCHKNAFDALGGQRVELVPWKCDL